MDGFFCFVHNTHWTVRFIEFKQIRLYFLVSILVFFSAPPDPADPIDRITYPNIKQKTKKKFLNFRFQHETSIEF